jgi:acetylornithine deacetylase
MIMAADRLSEEEVRHLGFLFTVGEELDSAGAKAANGLQPGSSYVVVGEPTENRLATGHKGSLKIVLRAEGRAAHSAYPEEGDSAIERLLDALGRVRRCEWGESPLLGKATVNIGTVEGGVAANVIAPWAEAQVFVRVVGKVEEAEGKLRGLLAGDPKLSYRVIARSDAVVCERLSGFDAAPVSFGTDIPYLGAFGKPLLVGPGSIRVAHRNDEFVKKEDLLRAVGLYGDIVRQLLERRA